MTRLFDHIWPSEVGNRTPAFVEWRSSKGYIIFVVMFATYTEILLYGLLLPVIPTALPERTGIPETEGQKWNSILLAIFCAARLVFSPIAGYLADRIESRQWPFISGLLASAVSTALLCAGTHIGLWIAARVFQGASSAVVWAVGLALIVDTVSTNELGQSMGYIGMSLTMGTVTGPLIGGVIYEHAGYYYVFALAFALLGFDIFCRLMIVENKARRKHSFPSVPEGQRPAEHKENLNKTSDSGFPVTESSDPTRDDLDRQMPQAGSIQTSVAVSATHKSKPPIYILMTSVRMLVAVWAFFVIFLLMSALDSVLPLFVQETFGWGQTAQGLIFLPLAIPHVVEPAIGYINDRKPNARPHVAAGAFLLLVPILVLLRFVSYSSLGQKVLLCALLAVVGFCIAALMPCFLAETSYIVQNKEENSPGIFGEGGAMALNYGIMNAACAAGGITGPLFGGLLREHVGWDVMAWVLALLMSVSTVLVLLIPAKALFNQASIHAASSSQV